MRYTNYTLKNVHTLPQYHQLPLEQKEAIQVVGHVLPFKANSYVVNTLINWEDTANDPLFRLFFPQRGMLPENEYQSLRKHILSGTDQARLKQEITRIRHSLNPHPAGQQEHNIPTLHGRRLKGLQHKYKETLLVFPSHGQSCHAFCSFCFRWPQFIGDPSLRFAMKDTQEMSAYLREHPEITDVLFTGGDPMTMSARLLESYISPLLHPEFEHIRSIRIGSKSLATWPYRFITAKDSKDILALFRRIKASGKHLAFMAHFNHPKEMAQPVARQAIEAVQEAGAIIRTQAPLLAHINDSAATWATMWRQQVDLGMVPYYMFLARDTGTQEYFGLPLVQALDIFRGAYRCVSGLCRTVRGPSMSAEPGKVEIVDTPEIHGKRYLALRFIQARRPEWAQQLFFAQYTDSALWLDDLLPAFGSSRFFFEHTP